EAVARHPVVLALVPPSIGATTGLPLIPPGTALPPRLPPAAATGGQREALLREALRLRSRWVQELTARTAFELGRRLSTDGTLADAQAVRHLRLYELAAMVRGEQLPTHRAPRPTSLPLPTAFRLTTAGVVVAVGAS